MEFEGEDDDDLKRVEEIRKRMEGVKLPAAMTATQDAVQLWAYDLPWALSRVEKLERQNQDLLDANDMAIRGWARDVGELEEKLEREKVWHTNFENASRHIGELEEEGEVLQNEVDRTWEVFAEGQIRPRDKWERMRFNNLCDAFDEYWKMREGEDAYE